MTRSGQGAGGRIPDGRARSNSTPRFITTYAARRRASRVSVVITAYNYGRYLDAAVQSCLDQTRLPDHIVLVDDGSTDDTAEHINAWKVAHPDLITAAHQVNSGGGPRNYGVSLSDEDYIICLDADDMLDARYVAAASKRWTRSRAGVAYTGLGILAADGSVQPNAWPPVFDWQAQTQPTNPPSNCIPCAAMFRRAMWARGRLQTGLRPARIPSFHARAGGRVRRGAGHR